MAHSIDDNSVLKCITNISSHDDLSREYKILLVAPQILEEVAKLERIGNYQVKAYIGNDDVQNGFFKRAMQTGMTTQVKKHARYQSLYRKNPSHYGII